MDKSKILTILQNEKAFLQKTYGLLSIGLFGSFSKDLQNTDSDIDLLVELAEPRFNDLVGIQIYLEKKLGIPVEIIRKRETLSERFLRRIEKDMLHV